MKRENYRSRGQPDRKEGFLFSEQGEKLSIFVKRRESADKGDMSDVRVKMWF